MSGEAVAYEEQESESALAAMPESNDVEQPEVNPDAPKEQPQEKGKGRPLEDRLQRAEVVIQRHKDNQRKLYKELTELKQSYGSKESEYARMRQEAEAFAQLKARLADGDEDALRELGTSLELFVERRLDPEYARSKKAATETEMKLKQLEDLIKQRDEQEKRATLDNEVRTYVSEVFKREDTYPDLVLVDPKDVAELGLVVAPMLQQEFGRVPTLHEIATASNKILEGYHRKVYESMSKRERARAEAEAAKAAEAAEEVKKAPPKAAKPAPLPPKPASTISTKMATQAATAKQNLSAAERRELAVKKLKALNGAELPRGGGSVDILQRQCTVRG